MAMVLRARLAVLFLAGIALVSACSTRPERPKPRPTKPVAGEPQEPQLRYERARWADLPGWRSDETQDAWPAFLRTCDARATKPEWSEVCKSARAATVRLPEDARDFFERSFDPYGVSSVTGHEKTDSGLVTGYYEPLLSGARAPSGAFQTPLYSAPPDLLLVDLSSIYPELKGKRVRGRLEGQKVVPYYSRAELAAGPAQRGNEIIWIDDALDAFLLQVQGSGRVKLPSGETIRLQYADQNGHPYRSIGRYLVEKGELTVEQADMPGIRAWLAAHPDRLQEVLNANPSIVFFREEPLADPALGPKGALGVPLIGGRSIAVDPASIPLGAPVYLATTLPRSEQPLQRLVLAQDTGGAIRGAVRADFFWGFGPAAGEQAGKMRQQGRMWLLWPKGVALPGVAR